MAFGGFDKDHSQPVSEINVTPLVDVMLVLLVIFLVTAPLFTHAVRVDLPSARAQPVSEKPETIMLSIDREGRVFWNSEAITFEALSPRLALVAAKQPQPELHIQADQNIRYREVVKIMAAAQNAGVHKVGFITDPVKKETR